jgi:hypothetical protein
MWTYRFADLRLYPKVPLLALAGLVHLRIPFPLLILGGAWCRDDGRIDDRALLHRHPVGHEVGLHGFKNLLTQIVLLEQMPERQDRGLIRNSVDDQRNAGKAAHRRHLNQRILHRRIAQVVPLLQQVDPQHGLQQVRRPATLAAGSGVVGLDQLNERFPRHNGLHLSQEALALGAVFCRRLLVITETELLGAHEASAQLRPQAYSRAR